VTHERTEAWDRQQIHDVVLRYCQGIDRLDMDLVRSAYHPDGVDHHTGFDGTVDEFVTWVSGPLAEHLAGTMHVIGNHRVELFGDDALSETYLTAVHWGTDPGSPASFTTGARYVDHMTLRDGRWAITERWAVREWLRPEGGVLAPASGSGPQARRDGSDPVQVLRERLTARARAVGSADSGRSAEPPRPRGS
jgi:hypothetical protein